MGLAALTEAFHPRRDRVSRATDIRRRSFNGMGGALGRLSAGIADGRVKGGKTAGHVVDKHCGNTSR
jgi:hypothetical protein